VACKVISQNAIPKDSVVVLSKQQARQVVSDLVRYDVLKQITKIQEKRIEGFTEKENLFNKELLVNSTIIESQNDLIVKQNKLISDSRKIHGYIAIINNEMLLSQTAIRFSLLTERQKIKGGLTYTVQQTHSPVWGIILEYKLF
jgi:hypothetical protein